MHVLHYLSSLRPELGGTVRAVVDLCGALAAGGHGVTVATAEPGGPQDQWSAASGGAPTSAAPRLLSVPAPVLPGHAFRRSALPQLRELVREADVLHVHGAWEYGNVQLCRIATALGKPYVVSVHGMLDAWCMRQAALKKTAYLALAGRRWLRNAELIHLTAPSELLNGTRYFSAARARVVPLLVDLGPFRSLPGPEAAEAMLREVAPRPRVLFLSRLHPKKNLETLLAAARLLARRGRRLCVVVAGDGGPRYVAGLKSLAASSGVDVAFLGTVTGSAKLSLFQACDVFALPTRHENFGLALVEALACGLPVVTTPAVGIAAQLRASGAVTLAEAAPAPFADAVERALDGTRPADAGERGRRWVLEAFEPGSSLRRFESLYDEALRGRRASPPATAPASLPDCS